MKKLIIPIAALLMLASCANENDTPEVENNNVVEITSDLSTQNFIDICSQIEFEVDSRADNDLVLTEPIAKEKLEPLVLDGRNLQRQLLKEECLEELTETEKEYISTLSDEDCANLSFIYHTIIEKPIDEAVIITDNELNKAYSVSAERIIHCALEAVGFIDLKKLSVNGVINAKTVTKALYQVGKRYLGYIGIAYAIYDFYNCIS